MPVLFGHEAQQGEGLGAPPGRAPCDRLQTGERCEQCQSQQHGCSEIDDRSRMYPQPELGRRAELSRRPQPTIVRASDYHQLTVWPYSDIINCCSFCGKQAHPLQARLCLCSAAWFRVFDFAIIALQARQSPNPRLASSTPSLLLDPRLLLLVRPALVTQHTQQYRNRQPVDSSTTQGRAINASRIIASRRADLERRRVRRLEGPARQPGRVACSPHRPHRTHPTINASRAAGTAYASGSAENGSSAQTRHRVDKTRVQRETPTRRPCLLGSRRRVASVAGQGVRHLLALFGIAFGMACECILQAGMTEAGA
eukprot:700512-Rhodomonas_salina.1